jgi:hypothetical protein
MYTFHMSEVDVRIPRKARGTVALCLADASPPFHADKYAAEMKLAKALVDAEFEGRAECKRLWEQQEYERIIERDKAEPFQDTPWRLLKSVALPGSPDIYPFWYNNVTGESLRFDTGDPRVRERQSV